MLGLDGLAEFVRSRNIILYSSRDVLDYLKVFKTSNEIGLKHNHVTGVMALIGPDV